MGTDGKSAAGLVERVCEACRLTFRVKASWLAQNPNRGRFCSHKCHGDTLRKAVAFRCAACGKDFTRRPSEIAAGAGAYCSHRCWAQGRRKEALVHTCEVCGTQRTVSGFRRLRAQQQRFCSPACQGIAQRRRLRRTCESCGDPFEVALSSTTNGRGRFCSPRCADAARRRPVELVCERCGRSFTVIRSAGGRRFCSWACYVGPERGSCEVACLTCGTVRRVNLAILKKGNGRFCSRACYFRYRGQGRVQKECRKCGLSFSVPTSARSQKYCSRACADAATWRAKRRYKCRACGEYFLIPSWRASRRFCSLACTNKGRRRRRDPEQEARNRFIVELHDGGKSAPQIESVLRERGLSWWLPPVSIRTVIHRAKAAPARP